MKRTHEEATAGEVIIVPQEESPPPLAKKQKRKPPKKDVNGLFFGNKRSDVKKSATIAKASAACFIVDLTPELRHQHLYPQVDLQGLGRLARTCSGFAKDLSKNSKSYNWLPAEWRKRLEKWRDKHWEHTTAIDRAFQLVVHKCIRPSSYFKQVKDAGKTWYMDMDQPYLEKTLAPEKWHFYIRIHGCEGDVYQNLNFDRFGRRDLPEWRVSDKRRYFTNAVKQLLASRREKEQLEEALKARPLEYDHDSPSFKALNTHYNNRLEVLKCQLNALGSIWHPDPVDIQRTLRELLETNCVELIQLQCVKDHFSGSQAYDWISDYMLEHYPKSKRAELRRKELLDEKKV